MSEIPPELLDAFTHQFAGYGNRRARVWFVGMEEGSGQSLEELRRRVHAWVERGARTLEDLPSYHHAIGLPKHFVKPWPLQRTWTPLLRFLLAWRGGADSSTDLRRVQATELGTVDGDSALVELLPLPAPSIADWPYASLARHHAALADRAVYRARYIPRRLELLRELIANSGARVVICYGLGYLEEWKALAGIDPVMRFEGETRWFWGCTANLQFAFVPHPVARGTRQSFWSELGRTLRTSAGDLGVGTMSDPG